jgi:hypothetical protein
MSLANTAAGTPGCPPPAAPGAAPVLRTVTVKLGVVALAAALAGASARTPLTCGPAPSSDRTPTVYERMPCASSCRSTT